MKSFWREKGEFHKHCKWILSFFVYLYHPIKSKLQTFGSQPFYSYSKLTPYYFYISSSRMFYDSATVKATVDPCLQNWFVLRGKPLWCFDRMDTGQKYVIVCTLAQRTNVLVPAVSRRLFILFLLLYINFHFAKLQCRKRFLMNFDNQANFSLSVLEFLHFSEWTIKVPSSFILAHHTTVFITTPTSRMNFFVAGSDV